MTIALIILSLASFITAPIFYIILWRKLPSLLSSFFKMPSPTIVMDNNKAELKQLEIRLNEMPNKLLESITGSISNNKGKLAELIAYINLKANYDKIIPLGGIVDFVGIRFAKDNDPGELSFIDIKNGKSARLSDDQKQLQKLIQSQRIQFLKVKVTTDAVRDITGNDPDVQ